MNIYVHIKEFFNIIQIPSLTTRDPFNPVLLLRFAEDRCDKNCPFVHQHLPYEGTKWLLKHPQCLLSMYS